jgi:hypothetical protein
MSRIAAFLAVLLWAGLAYGQVPPGFPYDAAKHPNPILTYVTSQDFKPSTYSDAQKLTGRELLGLAQNQGRQESIDVVTVPSKTQKVKILRRDVEVVFYPVVRQTFALSKGGRLTLYSYKFPRLPVSLEEAAATLNEAAFDKRGKPADARFGTIIPEKIEVRGRDGLLFDSGTDLTVFWVEDGVVYTATAALRQSDLIRLIEDLL